MNTISVPKQLLILLGITTLFLTPLSTASLNSGITLLSLLGLGIIYFNIVYLSDVIHSNESSPIKAITCIALPSTSLIIFLMVNFTLHSSSGFTHTALRTILILGTATSTLGITNNPKDRFCLTFFSFSGLSFFYFFTRTL